VSSLEGSKRSDWERTAQEHSDLERKKGRNKSRGNLRGGRKEDRVQSLGQRAGLRRGTEEKTCGCKVAVEKVLRAEGR